MFGPRSQSNGAELADIINNYTKSENLHATALVMQVFREGFYTTKSLQNDKIFVHATVLRRQISCSLHSSGGIKRENKKMKLCTLSCL